MSLKVGFMKARKFSENRDGRRWILPSRCKINSHSFFNGIGNGQSCGYQEWAIAYDSKCRLSMNDQDRNANRRDEPTKDFKFRLASSLTQRNLVDGVASALELFYSVSPSLIVQGAARHSTRKSGC
ncbi:hypothetical protein LINPERPRIM_LOCUS45271 [Linum perenne]